MRKENEEERAPTVCGGGQRLLLLSEEFCEVAQVYRVRTTISTRDKGGTFAPKNTEIRKKAGKNLARSVPLGSAKDDEADLGRDAEADGGADRAQAAIHIEMGNGRQVRVKERRTGRLGGGSVRSSTISGSWRKKRTLVKAGNVIGDKARGTKAVIENFDLNLSAVGVTGEGKLDAEFGGAIERVWIVRQENVGHVAANEWLDIRKGLLSLAVAHAFTLVIDADKVELGALESD